MNYHQIILLALLIFAIILFMMRWIRYDLVAGTTLLLATFLGIVPFNKVFSGFSHNAVITLAAVYIISRAIENTGILDKLSDHIRLKYKKIWKQLGIICLTELGLSIFLNNVAATALMIPVTLKIARIKNIPRNILLMPLAFSSLLGGLITLISTPSNLIISDYRSHYLQGAFSFFAFTPVGLSTSILGIAFMVFFGWKLIPKPKQKADKTKIEKFTVELDVTSSSPLIHKKMAKMMEEFQDKFKLIALVRNNEVIHENLGYYSVKTHDMFILETDKWTLNDLIDEYQLELKTEKEAFNETANFFTEIILLPRSPLCEKSIEELHPIKNYGFDIVAISRQEETLTERLNKTFLHAGDVLLIKSEQTITQDKLDSIHCLIMGQTHLRPFSLMNTLKVFSIFIAALGVVITGLLSTALAFATAAIIMILTRCISVEKAYRSIDLPILVLIATMLPIGDAMQSTGIANLIAKMIYTTTQHLPIWISILGLMWVCLLFANTMSNAAVALIFAPIALQLASHWHVSPDTFLMSVAVASCLTFLSPIGHPANMLILSQGNYRFSDYWQMGLPLTLFTSCMSLGLILLFWPLHTH